MSRVADTASHSTLLNNLNRSIERARDIQVQVSTGKVGQDYAAIGRDSKRLVSLEGRTLPRRPFHRYQSGRRPSPTKNGERSRTSDRACE